MIILRSKIYSDIPLSPDSNEQKNSQDLMIEQMKMQRAMMQNQRQRQKLQAQETRDRMRTLQTAQRVEQQKDEQEQKTAMKVKKMENDSSEAKNVGLYKTKSRPVAPVPMKS